MRVVVCLGLLGGVAVADNKPVCAVHDATASVTERGCFETPPLVPGETEWGTRVCLVHVEPGGCFGVFDVFGGGNRLAPQLLSKASCTAADGAVMFRGAWVTSSMTGVRDSMPLSFTGALDGDRLRGTFRIDGESKRVAWKRVKSKRTTAAQVRRLTAKACAKQGT